MEIKRTRIQHKRYTMTEWSEGVLIIEIGKKVIPYLAQGEIGVLLSNDRSQVLEVRIGTNPNGNQKFVDGLLLGYKEQEEEYCIKQYPNRASFPNVGSQGNLYIDQFNNSLWRWDDATATWQQCNGGSSGEGGHSLTPEEKEKLNIIRKDGVGDKYLADDGNYKTIDIIYGGESYL